MDEATTIIVQYATTEWKIEQQLMCIQLHVQFKSLTGDEIDQFNPPGRLQGIGAGTLLAAMHDKPPPPPSPPYQCSCHVICIQIF